jgi:hypothetical protein
MNDPVDNLDDAYNACNPDKPLEADDERYIDLAEVRNGEAINLLTDRITRTKQSEGFHKQLFTGHIGSGKSTELKRLQKQLQDRQYFVVFFDVQQSLDLGEINYKDVLLNIAQAVTEALEDSGITLNEALFNDVEAWFTDKIVSEIYEKNVNTKAEVVGEGKVGFPFMASLLAKLTGEIRSGSTYRTEIRNVLERDLSLFIAKLNDLLLAARLQLQDNGFIDLVVIVDGLEKMRHRILKDKDNESSYSDFFITHAEQLNAPACHVIYTVPIAVSFSFNTHDFYTDRVFVLPMVKYKEPAGQAQLIALIKKRLDVDRLFESERLLIALINMSGGSMRDLFLLIRAACETAENSIKQADVDRAIRNLVKDYDRMVQKDFVPLLNEVDIDQRLPTDGDKKYEPLLRLRLVHEYENGERWAALHPALSHIRWLQTAFAKLRATSAQS